MALELHYCSDKIPIGENEIVPTHVLSQPSILFCCILSSIFSAQNFVMEADGSGIL